MAKILLIPGYGTGVTYTPWRREVIALRGFGAFENTSGVAVYAWGERRDYGWLESLNPLASLGLYRRETSLAAREDTLAQLTQIIEVERPKVIVAHSMGGVLLLGAMASVAGSVERVIFVGSDVRMNAAHIATIQAWQVAGVEVYNVWCWWDPALWSSAIVNLSWPLGLGRHKLLQNVFLPLTRLPNLHESSLQDTRLLRLAQDT